MNDINIISAEETLLSTQVGTISCLLAKKLGIKPSEAYLIFAKSDTYKRLADPSTKLNHYSDLYIIDEFLKEKNQ